MRLSIQEESKIISEIANEINQSLPELLEGYPKLHFSCVLHQIPNGYELLWELRGRMEDNAWFEFQNNLRIKALSYNVIKKICKL